MTRSEILVFMTQDSLFKGNERLKDLIRPLENSGVAAAYGRQVLKEDANPVEEFVRSFNYPSGRVMKGMDDLPKWIDRIKFKYSMGVIKPLSITLTQTVESKGPVELLRFANPKFPKLQISLEFDRAL